LFGSCNNTGVSTVRVDYNNGTFLCSNCIFVANIVGKFGGCIILYSSRNNTFENCTFLHSVSNCGGAIFHTEIEERDFKICTTNLFIFDCFFTNCSARDNGGALSINSSNITEIKRCSFVNCSAPNQGKDFFS
jgi:hypothetical protein